MTTQVKIQFCGTNENGTDTVSAYAAGAELLLRCMREGAFKDVTVIASHPQTGVEIVTSMTPGECEEQISAAFKGLCEVR